MSSETEDKEPTRADVDSGTPQPSVTPTPSGRPSGIATRARRSTLPPPSVLLPRGRIAERLPTHAPIGQRFVRGVRRLLQGLYHHDEIFHAAPGMAFHFFLSLLPLLVFVGYVLGLIAEHEGVASIISVLLHNLPPTTEALVSKEVGRLTDADRLGPLAAIGFFWIASGGTQGLMQAVERVVGVPRRAWWRQRLLALGWVVATLIAFAVASFGVIQWENVVGALGEDGPAVVVAPTPSATPLVSASSSTDPTNASPSAEADTRHSPGKVVAIRARKFLRSGGQAGLAMIVSILAAVGGLAAFYHFSVAPSQGVRRRVFPGAFLAVALIMVVSWGFSLYVRTLATYTVYYGSLAAIAVLLIWLWLVSLAILVGAELNSQLEGLRDLSESISDFEDPTIEESDLHD